MGILLSASRVARTLALAVSLGFGAQAIAADIAFNSPRDGLRYPTEQVCDFAPCPANINVSIDVQVDTNDTEVIELAFGPADGSLPGSFTRYHCLPVDPNEPGDGSPCEPRYNFIRYTDSPNTRLPWKVKAGFWTLSVIVRTAAGVVTSESVTFEVYDAYPNRPEHFTLESYEVVPGLPASPQLALFENPDPADPAAYSSNEPGEIRIYGQNLWDLNQLGTLDIYLAAIGVADSDDQVLPTGGFNSDGWCFYGANGLIGGDNQDFRYPSKGEPGLEITRAENRGDGADYIEVRLPRMAEAVPWDCLGSAGGTDSAFGRRWRLVVRDNFSRPEREREWEAIPSPYKPRADRAPYLSLVKPEFMYLHSFNFDNKGEWPGYYEFLTVYRDNAYLCVGALGSCATYVPDVAYHTVYFPIFAFLINQSGGSCNGMAATSRQLANGTLEPTDFAPFNGLYSRVLSNDDYSASYKDRDWCTPLCSWPEPDNLWAKIRENHGYQLSTQFIGVISEHLLNGLLMSPAEYALKQLRPNPSGYVLCFQGFMAGHCVTPYQVDDNKIRVYDNNYIGNRDTVIEVRDDGSYYYEQRADDGDEPYEGKVMFAFPLSEWNEPPSLPGILDVDDATSIFTSVFGAADASIEAPGGAVWRWEDDGTLTNTIPGAITLPLLDQPEVAGAQAPVILPPAAGEPVVRVSSTGGDYMATFAGQGRAFQLLVAGAPGGEDDLLTLGYEQGGGLESVVVSPQSGRDHLVPRVALSINENASALFQWFGLQLAGGDSAGFAGDPTMRAVSFNNGSAAAADYLLALDYAEGMSATGSTGRMVYGPFQIPPGATHRVAAINWPAVGQVLSEIDLDGDGTPEYSRLVTGRRFATPLDFDAAADIVVTKEASIDEAQLGTPIGYTVTVTNAGPELAHSVTLADTLPEHAAVLEVQTSRGSCTADISCALGDMDVGESAVITYTVEPRLPGTFVNAVTAFASELDPAPANNSATTRTQVEAVIDIKPDDEENVLNVRSGGVLPVVILGSEYFDVNGIDTASLSFGPNAVPVDPQDYLYADFNADGVIDLQVHFGQIRDAGLSRGDTAACLSGALTATGQFFSGCDAIRTTR